MKRVSKSITCTALSLLFVASLVSVAPAKKHAQPLMKKALHHLKAARKKPVGKGKIKNLQLAKKALKKAAHDKGGFRVKAINKINKALKQIRNKKMGQANRLITLAIKDVKMGMKVSNKK